MIHKQKRKKKKLKDQRSIFILSAYSKRWKLILDFNEILNGISNSSQDTIDDMNNAIGSNLVAIDDPGTVNSNNLYLKNQAVED